MSEPFLPILRFIALSDVHYRDEDSHVRERMAKALRIAYRLAAQSQVYQGLDALCVVGDFADRGSEAQFKAFKQTLEEGLRPGTKAIFCMGSHEYMSSGPEAACEKLQRYFGQAPDIHTVIHGFHFIALSPSKGTQFHQEKLDWAAAELAKAAADAPRRPIFFCQHPHISDTVYGSILWGEPELTPILMNYPQVVNFSGHSHAPVNDPRSIHQRHFTCLGTGTLDYFEMDEFDKYYGTFPPEKGQAAQFLLVEADAQGRVRVTPYDILTDRPFPFVWKIDEPWEPRSFPHTNAKRRAAALPHCFAEGTPCRVEGSALTFGQARAAQEYVNDYLVRVRRGDEIVRQIALWSGYHLMDMPKTLTVELGGLAPGVEYSYEITARGFWDNESADKLCGSFTAI